MTADPPPKHRYIDAFPKPVLAVFAVAAAAAIAAIAFAFASSSGGEISLAERRPPPRSVFTHDVGEITPAPLPRAGVPAVPPACAEYGGTKLVAGGDGITRLRQALVQICPLIRGGPAAEATAAARALDGVTLRFGRFARTGVDSTTDTGARIVWLNAKFALRSKPLQELIPVILHEAAHLAAGGATPTASRELAARSVELAACRQFIEIDEWPRSCEDSRRLAEMPSERAIELLVAAGYAG